MSHPSSYSARYPHPETCLNPQTTTRTWHHPIKHISCRPQAPPGGIPTSSRNPGSSLHPSTHLEQESALSEPNPALFPPGLTSLVFSIPCWHPLSDTPALTASDTHTFLQHHRSLHTLHAQPKHSSTPPLTHSRPAQPPLTRSRPAKPPRTCSGPAPAEPLFRVPRPAWPTRPTKGGRTGPRPSGMRDLPTLLTRARQRRRRRGPGPGSRSGAARRGAARPMRSVAARRAGRGGGAARGGPHRSGGAAAPRRAQAGRGGAADAGRPLSPACSARTRVRPDSGRSCGGSSDRFPERGAQAQSAEAQARAPPPAPPGSAGAGPD